jgi:methionine transaminase
MLISKLPKVGTTIFSVMSQLASAHRAINLGQGFPDFEGPLALREQLARHVASGKNQYAPMIGVESLRLEIARKTERLYGRKTDPTLEVTVVSGASEALYVAIAAVVHPGDEVIVFDPSYDSYDPAITLAGGVPVHIPMQAPEFLPDWDRVRQALSPKTRMILINSPHNPSGAMLRDADMQALSALIADRDIYVLSDEVYEHITFDNREHASVLRYPELAARSFAVSSFGKTYHITGWKIGYCVAPPALSAEFRKVHQYLTFSTFTAAQYALADYMAADSEHALALGQFYQEKRDDFQALLQPSRFRLLPVAGAYFQLADYSAISDQSDVDFCSWLVREKGVAAIPVSAFYEQPPELRLVRFCFAKNAATLAEGAARLCAI